MYLSLNSVPIGGNLSWPDFARLAASTGFRGVDVNLDAAMKDGAGATGKLLADLKLRPAFVNLPVEFRKGDAEFRESLARLEPAAAFAQAIACPRMMTYIMPSSSTPKDELRRIYKQRFTEIARVLSNYGVRLGLEFLGPVMFRKRESHEFIWRMPEMLAFAKECGPNVGLTVDAWHWCHAGGTIQDILDARGRIIVVHFDDSPDLPPELIRDNERLLPGEGVIQLTRFLHALRDAGYNEGLSIEVFGRGLKELPPRESARLCLEAGRKVLAQAGIGET